MSDKRVRVFGFFVVALLMACFLLAWHFEYITFNKKKEGVSTFSAAEKIVENLGVAGFVSAVFGIGIVHRLAGFLFFYKSVVIGAIATGVYYISGLDPDREPGYIADVVGKNGSPNRELVNKTAYLILGGVYFLSCCGKGAKIIKRIKKRFNRKKV